MAVSAPQTIVAPAIEVRGLVRRYADVIAVNGLDLEVRGGECFGLLGPNGAGKTTTIEILEGLNRPDAGEVRVLGQRWTGGADRALRERLGIQLQETKLQDKVSVIETLELFRSFYRRGPAADEVMRRVALEDKRDAWVVKLSGGQKQRLSLACALVNDPELLFLDEPTTGLDPQSRRQVWDLVESFRARGGTTLLTTHYMDEAERLCDRVAIMDHGRVIALGTPRALIAEIIAEHLVEFSAAEGEVSETALRTLPGVSAVKAQNGGWQLEVTALHRTVPALIAALEQQRVVLSELRTHSESLEDVFVKLTGRHLRDE